MTSCTQHWLFKDTVPSAMAKRYKNLEGTIIREAKEQAIDRFQPYERRWTHGSGCNKPGCDSAVWYKNPWR